VFAGYQKRTWTTVPGSLYIALNQIRCYNQTPNELSYVYTIILSYTLNLPFRQALVNCFFLNLMVRRDVE